MLLPHDEHTVVLQQNQDLFNHNLYASLDDLIDGVKKYSYEFIEKEGDLTKVLDYLINYSNIWPMN
jgi:hypothetical protein